MTIQDNNDLEKIQNKFDLKQFSEYQIAISKQALHGEFEKLHKELNHYKIKFWVTLATIAGLTGLGSIFTWNRIIEDLNSKVSSRLDVEVNNIRDSINVRLTREFETSRIKKLVESKAQEYTEKNAKQYIETKVDSKINPFIRSAESKITQIDISVLEAKILNDNKDAYDQLKSMQKKENKPELNVIINKLSQRYSAFADYWKFPDFLPEVLYNQDGKLVIQDSISTEKLFSFLDDNDVIYINYMSMLYTISKRPKKELLVNALYTLKTSKSIKACVSSVHIIMHTYKKQGDYMDFDKWIHFIELELNK